MKVYAIRTESMGDTSLVDQDAIEHYQVLINDEIEAAGIEDVEVVVVDGKYDDLPRRSLLDEMYPGLADALERAWERLLNES